MDTDPVTAVLDRGEAVAKQLMESLQNLATEYGPDAYHLVLTKIRIDSFQQVLTGVALLVVAGVGFKMTIRYAKHFWAKYEKSRADGSHYSSGDDFSAQLVGFFGTVLSGASFALSLTCLFDVWCWVGLFSPDMKLARDIIEKVLG